METEKSMRNERWAVVTGASSGIGFAIARRLAMRGYNIFAAAKDVERLDECARKLSGECGIRVRTYAADHLPFLHIQNKNRLSNSFLLYICTLYFANLLKTNPVSYTHLSSREMEPGA